MNILHEIIKEEAKQLNHKFRISDKGNLVIDSQIFLIIFGDDRIVSLHRDSSHIIHTTYSQYTNLKELIEHITNTV